MFKKFAVCTLGLVSGIAVAACTDDTVNGLISFGSSKPTEVAEPSSDEVDIPTSWTVADAESQKPSDSPLQTDGSAFKAISGADVISLSDFHDKQKEEPVSIRIKTPPTEPFETARTQPSAEPQKNTTPLKPILKKSEVVKNNSAANSQNQTELQSQAESQDQVLERYSRHVFKSTSGNKLNYRMMQPRYFDSKETYPLVVFMHGAGERGSDNELHLAHGAKDFASEENSRAFPCFAIFPQCPEDQQWVNTDWRELSHVTPDKPSDSMASLMELIDEVIVQQPINCDRIYVTGLSMGGFGVFDLASRRPNMFAAAAPLCGGGDASPEIAKRLSKIPMWIVHGDNDGAVNVSRSRQMVKAIKNAGGEPIYEELAGVGHNVWTQNYANPKFYDWMFDQSLNTPAASPKAVASSPKKKRLAIEATPKQKSVMAKKPVMKEQPTKQKQLAVKSPVIQPDVKSVDKSSPKKNLLTKKSTKRLRDTVKTQQTTEKRSVEQANLELPDPFSSDAGENPAQRLSKELKAKANLAQKELPKKTATDKQVDVSREAGSFEEAFEKMNQEQEVVFTPDYLSGIQEKDLEGTWKAVVARYKGNPMPQASLDNMEFTFKSGTMRIVQSAGGSAKSQSGKLTLGDIVKTDLVVARRVEFAPPKKSGQTIKGLFYFENEQLVLLLNGPGEPSPDSFRDAKKGRLLVLERNE